MKAGNSRLFWFTLENSNEQANEKDKGISFTGELKELKASLDVEKIKPADRVAFLLNYLYL